MVRVLADWVSGETRGSLVGRWLSSCHVLTRPFLGACAERRKRTLGSGLHPCDLVTSLEVTCPNPVPPAVRASPYEFGGDTDMPSLAVAETRIRGNSKVWGLPDWKAVPPLGDIEGVRGGAVFGGEGQENRSGRG